MKGMTSEDNSSGGQNWTGPRMISGEGILDRTNAHLKRQSRPREELERQADTKGSVGWIQEAHRVRGWIVLFGRVS